MELLSWFNTLLSKFNTILLIFLFGELILTIVFTKDWKFRRNKAKGYPHLRPYSKAYKITFVVLLIILVIIPILDLLLWSHITNFIAKMRFYQLNLLFFCLPIVYLWVEKRIIEKKFKWHLLDYILIFIPILSVLVGLIFYFKLYLLI